MTVKYKYLFICIGVVCNYLSQHSVFYSLSSVSFTENTPIMILKYHNNKFILNICTD